MVFLMFGQEVLLQMVVSSGYARSNSSRMKGSRPTVSEDDVEGILKETVLLS
jgi:hypothetical protein